MRYSTPSDAAKEWLRDNASKTAILLAADPENTRFAGVPLALKLEIQGFVQDVVLTAVIDTLHGNTQ